MADAVNVHEAAARRRKANRLADMLVALRPNDSLVHIAEDALGFPEETWTALARAAGTHVPSRKSQLAVVTVLRSRAAAQRSQHAS